jgi:hypothetical protein
MRGLIRTCRTITAIGLQVERSVVRHFECNRSCHYWGLGPIVMTMTLGVLSIPPVAMSGPAAIPSALSASAKASTRGCSAFPNPIEYMIITPGSAPTAIPACGPRPAWVAAPRPDKGGSLCQPANSSDRLISRHISHASFTSETIPEYCWPRNCSIFLDMRLRASGGINLGAIRVSSVMILDRCNDAMCSSDTKRQMLNTVSSTTPHITKWNARRFTCSGYLSDSKIIPIPSNNAEAISAFNNHGLIADRKSSEKMIGNCIGVGILSAAIGIVLLLNHRLDQSQKMKRNKTIEILRRGG